MATAIRASAKDMSVEALICDASGTLIDDDGAPQPGVRDMLQRLRGMGVKIVLASNQAEGVTRELLGELNEYVDHLICHEHVGANKGSGQWIDVICDRLKLRPNQFFYLGNTKWDMITATRGPIVYAHAGWSGVAFTGY